MTETSVLFVCTGNICRSPIAEFYLRELLSPDEGIVVSSAGTHALHGEKMPQRGIDHANQLGLNGIERHRARTLSEMEIASSSLILTMTLEQRRAVIELVPSAMRKTFSVREFARISGFTQAVNSSESFQSSAEFVRSFAEARGVAGAAEDPARDEVVDPYREPDEVWQRCLQQLIPALDVIGERIRTSILPR